MAFMNIDENGDLQEPCLSCEKTYVDNIFYDWHCDEKECIHCNRTDEKIAKSFTSDVEAVKNLLRWAERIEEWWKKVCIGHNCIHYIHEDYPKCGYCTCPNDCILVDKQKSKSEE